MKLSNEERKTIGKNGYELVIEKFTWDKVTNDLLKTYDWLYKKTEKPEFVYVD
jgi:poly(glycerol-phosphate) alpha-glucosyltransferase